MKQVELHVNAKMYLLKKSIIICIITMVYC